MARYHPPFFSVAPMMEWTDNHFRTLARLISKHSWLYTEMVAAETIVYQEGNLFDIVMDLETCKHRVNELRDCPLEASEDVGEINVGGKVVVNEAKAVPLLGPVTPDSNKETGDVLLDDGSPLTAVKYLSRKVLSFSSGTKREEEQIALAEDDSSPRTPKDGVFDPFAPGPDDMVLAPLCKNYFDQARAVVARRLNFGSFKGMGHGSTTGKDAMYVSDEEMLESVYENLLEAIVFKQVEGSLGEVNEMQRDFDGCQTPPLAPRLSVVADTCPGAPMKPNGKLRMIDLGLCRKLEF